MKTIQFLTAGCFLFIMACTPMKQLAQNRSEGSQDVVIVNNLPLTTGTYYIVNASDMALTPWNNGPGENAFLQNFNHGGMQQWRVTKAANTNIYNIKMAGTDAMYFQPNYVKDHTPMVGPGKNDSGFRIQSVAGNPEYWVIKSFKFNGDALHSFVFSPGLPTEMRFDPLDGSRKFMWRFVKVKE